MAKKITDEEIKLSIVINGNSAQKQLIDLEKATRSLTEEKKNLQLELKRVETSLGKDSEEYKKLKTEIAATTKSIESNKNSMKELQNQIGITGLTIAQLRDKANMLKLTLKNLIPGSEDYKKYDTELKQVSTRLGELSGRAKESGFSISSLADSFNKYAALGASVIATLTGVVFTIQQMIDFNGKLSDAQADVMKTTGMTKKEVDELGKSFGILQTRTSRIDLYKIAEQGGRLGVQKAEIQDFVENMNMAAVALGDSFTGGVDQVAEQLGKIKFLFKETKDMNVEQAYNSIGSAINDLGANGTANEANIAEFTKRIGSLTDVLKPSVQETLALGTAFEESGIEAETSSRAYNIFMKQASTESAKFAKVMGISTKSVEDMINTNPMNFMLDFSKGLNGMDATQVAKTLDFLGVNADGANKVIGAMGNNFNRFHELIDLSNNSFATGSSLINEYNIKNNNLAGTLEKVSKKVSGWFSSESFTNWLGGAVLWFSKFIGATEDADGSVQAWKNTLAFTAKVIAIVTAALITNSGWQKLVALWTNRNTEATILYNIAAKARAFADGVALIATQAYAVVTMLLTGNLTGATQAFRIMTSAMMTTPWGFILSALAAVVVAYKMFSKEISTAAKSQQMLSDIQTETSKNIEKEKTEVERLVKIAKDERVQKDLKLEAIKKLNEISPKYLGNLTLENITTAKGTELLKAYTTELYNNARAKAVQAKFDELAKQKVEAEGKSANSYKDQTLGGKIANFFGQDNVDFKNREELNAYIIKTFSKQLNVRKDKQSGLLKYDKKIFESFVESYLHRTGLDIKEAEIQDIDSRMKLLEEELTANTVKDLGKKDATDSTKSTYNVPSGSEDKNKAKKEKQFKTLDEMAKERLDFETKTDEELLKLQRQFEDDNLAIKQDGYTKDLALENQRYQREIQDLEKQKVHKEEMAKLDIEIAKAKKSGDARYYDFLIQLKKDWQSKNEKLDDQINKIQEGKLYIHNLKIASIEDKAAKDYIAKAKEKFDAEKIIRETEYYNQLAALGTNEKAKTKLKKEFEQNELTHQEVFLKELLDKFNIIIGKGHLDKIDLSLLTPEQVLEFQKEAEKVGLTLAELIDKRNSLSANENADNLNKLGLKGSTDIFGFTPDNWDTLFKNLETGKIGINEMVFAVSALSDMYSKYSSFLDANENRQLKQFEQASDKKKTKLKRQLDSGYISQDQYNKAVDKIDKSLEKEKAELDYKQAKRQKAIAAMNVITSTAQAIIGIWAQVPKFDFGATAAILSGVVGALGALQLATVLKTPLPARGAQEGYYPNLVKREQDGKTFKTTGTSSMKSGLFSKPRLLVGEGPGDMPEMVIDKKAYSQISPETKNALLRELKGIKGFENGYYNPSAMRFETPATTTNSSASSSDELLHLVLNVVQENTLVMKDLRDKGVVGKFLKNDLKSAKDMQDMISDYNTLRNSNKK